MVKESWRYLSAEGSGNLAEEGALSELSDVFEHIFLKDLKDFLTIKIFNYLI